LHFCYTSQIQDKQIIVQKVNEVFVHIFIQQKVELMMICLMMTIARESQHNRDVDVESEKGRQISEEMSDFMSDKNSFR
jgi:hypothetical protein